SKLAGESARGGMLTFFRFMALLSLNLGILNLLPIPVLDGGHLVYLVIEGIIRREISTKVKLIIQQIGMFLILALMIFAVYNDLFRIFGD
ncbi:MAG: site-2 protease family protein, partial [bacterium]